MWRILTDFGLLERPEEPETIRENDGGSGPRSGLTDTSNLTPASSGPSSGYIAVSSGLALSPPSPAVLAPTRNTMFRYTPRGLVYRGRHEDTKEDIRVRFRQPRLGRRLESSPGVAVSQPGSPPNQDDNAEHIVPERSCAPGDNWPQGRVEGPSEPPSLLPLTGQDRLADWVASGSSDSHPEHHHPSDHPSPSFSERSKSTVTLGRDNDTAATTTTTATKNETPPQGPPEQAKPRYTHGLAMARAAGNIRIVGPPRAPLLPRGPPRSDGRDARADPMAVVSPRRQGYPKLEWYVEPWREDQRQARVYSRLEYGKLDFNKADKLWFYTDLRKGYHDSLIRQTDAERDAMEERMVDFRGTDKETVTWRPVPHSGSFGPGWVFLDPMHGWIRC